MSDPQAPFAQFQNLLREMFQFDHNELDFGLFKVLRLKRTYIEQFISGEGVQDLQHIVARELESIRGADTCSAPKKTGCAWRLTCRARSPT